MQHCNFCQGVRGFLKAPSWPVAKTTWQNTIQQMKLVTNKKLVPSRNDRSAK